MRHAAWWAAGADFRTRRLRPVRDAALQQIPKIIQAFVSLTEFKWAGLGPLPAKSCR
jgi:hypothetical protein